MFFDLVNRSFLLAVFRITQFDFVSKPQDLTSIFVVLTSVFLILTFLLMQLAILFIFTTVGFSRIEFPTNSSYPNP